jgi:hypothetical protein
MRKQRRILRDAADGLVMHSLPLPIYDWAWGMNSVL